jgi:hypothetical protein
MEFAGQHRHAGVAWLSKLLNARPRTATSRDFWAPHSIQGSCKISCAILPEEAMLVATTASRSVRERGDIFSTCSGCSLPPKSGRTETRLSWQQVD